MITVTPSLMVGDRFDATRLDDLTWVETPLEAVSVILEGHSALIPEEDWKDTASTILQCLGCDDHWIKNRIRFAETGQL